MRLEWLDKLKKLNVGLLCSSSGCQWWIFRVGTWALLGCRDVLRAGYKWSFSHSLIILLNIAFILHLKCIHFTEISVSWDVMPCSLLKVISRFGGICRLHLQSRRVSQERNQEGAWIMPVSATRIFRNVGWSSRDSVDSSIGIATDYMLNGGGPILDKGKISLFTLSQSALGPATLPIHWVPSDVFSWVN
jgi:hypothetical protein